MPHFPESSRFEEVATRVQVDGERKLSIDEVSEVLWWLCEHDAIDWEKWKLDGAERKPVDKKSTYLAAEASLKDAQQQSNESRLRMTQLLAQVEDETLRLQIMEEFHTYASWVRIRAKCNEILKRDGHS